MTRTVAFCDPRAEDHAYQGELLRAVAEVIESGRFVLGPQVEAFEAEAARYLGVEHAIGVASGTDALYLALRALGVSAGHEVLLPSMTFFATAEAIAATGASPIPIDSLAVNALAGAASARTRALVVVNLHGAALDLRDVQDWATRQGVALIEDACQAFGARLNGVAAGARGVAGCFSFYPSKVLGGAGDGGLVVTSNAEMARLVRSLRQHGRSRDDKYRHVELGSNSRLDEIQAAYLRVKLRHLDAAIGRRRRVARAYSQRLASSHLQLPEDREAAIDTFYGYSVKSRRRDGLLDALSEASVEARVHFPLPVHLQPAFVDRYGPATGSFDQTIQLAREQLSLPCHPAMTEADVALVCDVIAAFEEEL